MGGKDDGRADGRGVCDAEWARFMAEAAAGTGDAPREPSARKRMVADRLREERARGREPPRWRAGPDGPGAPGGRGRPRRRIKAGLAVLGHPADGAEPLGDPRGPLRPEQGHRAGPGRGLRRGVPYLTRYGAGGVPVRVTRVLRFDHSPWRGILFGPIGQVRASYGRLLKLLG